MWYNVVMVKHRLALRGDTMIEILFALSIFSFISVSTVTSMNKGTLNLQTSIETTMARAAMDEQAEAIRFAHAAYEARRGDGGLSETVALGGEYDEELKYAQIWQQITDHLAVTQSMAGMSFGSPGSPMARAITGKDSISSCSVLYKKTNNETNTRKNVMGGRFVIDTKNFTLHASAEDQYNYGLYFEAADVYPKLTYTTADGTSSSKLLGASTMKETKFDKAQGIMVLAVKSDNGKEPSYYDFYIRTCWDTSGQSMPNTLSTVIRLYNPDYVSK